MYRFNRVGGEHRKGNKLNCVPTRAYGLSVCYFRESILRHLRLVAKPRNIRTIDATVDEEF